MYVYATQFTPRYQNLHVCNYVKYFKVINSIQATHSEMKIASIVDGICFTGYGLVVLAADPPYWTKSTNLPSILP